MQDMTIIIEPGLDDAVASMIVKGDSALDIASKIAEAARGIAPVALGNYRDGIKAERTAHGARVIASDQKSTWVEFGIPSHNQPAQFVLRRAVDSLGLKFKKKKG